MDEMFHLCHKHINRRVGIHTRCGDYHEGVIFNVDSQNVYLRTSDGVGISWFGFGPVNPILTLSLFTLLAIVLI